MKLTRHHILTAALIISQMAGATTIREIKITARKIAIPEPEFVLAFTAVRAGEEVDQKRISRDVKTLMDTGHFTFVDSELAPVAGTNACDLIFVVEPRTRLEKPVTVIGAEAMGEKKVRKWLELEVGNYVDDALMNVQARKVTHEYHQRYYHDAQLSWNLDVNTNNGFTKVTLTVREGERASLRKVNFTGNTYAPPGLRARMLAGLRHQTAVAPESVPPETLQNAMQPRLWNIFSFFTKRGVYNPEELSADRDRLRELYFNRGYLDAQIGEPQIKAYKPGKLEATYPITENAQYRIGTLSINGATIFPETNLRDLIRIKSGDIAAMDAINQTANALRDYYQSRGYMRTTVRPILRAHLEEPVVDIEFAISEGSLIHVRYVDIRGNSTTRDKVIRRELLVLPGEIYNQVGVRRSENILRNLGFFETVNSYPRETMKPQQDDLVFDVEEKRTGQFMVGAGYSSVDELMGFIELSQGNFDLLNWPSFVGNGQKLRLRAQVGSQREDYEISFVEPWFLDRKLSLGVDLFDTKRSNLSDYYSEQRLGGAVTLGKPLPGFFQRVNLTYSLQSITLYDVATNAAPRIQADAGTWDESTMKLSFIHDTRNNVFVPTRGAKITVTGRVSGGPLGFDTDVYGLEADGAFYTPVIFDHVLSLRARAETINEYGDDDDVHMFDRLFLGGPRNLRGFKYRYVSPYEEGAPIGGKSSAFGSIEYSVPLYKQLLRFATFYDIGNVWLDAFDLDLLNYCSDIGIGLRLDIPGFPVRIDYAWPLEISGTDISRTSARFNFWLGYGF